MDSTLQLVNLFTHILKNLKSSFKAQYFNHTKNKALFFNFLTYFGAKVGRATFTADPSCAVHQDLLVSEQLQVLVHVVRKVAEFTDVRSQTMTKLSLED